jgi:hypothetical protein
MLLILLFLLSFAIEVNEQRLPSKKLLVETVPMTLVNFMQARPVIGFRKVLRWKATRAI